MIVSGLIQRADAGGAPSRTGASVQLSPGDTLSGRVMQLQNGGSRGQFRMADGTSFNFTGAQGLQEGERVQLQVVRLAPEVTFRLMNSESGAAARLAGSAEQSLIRAPDLFTHILNMVDTGNGKAGSQNALAGSWVTGKGQTLLSILQNNLPQLSVGKMAKGDLGDLIRLLESGSRQEIREAIRNFQRAASTLQSAHLPAADADLNPEVAAARTTLSRLGDLLAMQDILPRANLAQRDEGMFLGYRLFWLTEGGLGEAIWRREGRSRGLGREGGDGEETTSVLISLNMTQLGVIQARLSFGQGRLLVGITAEEEESLAWLRGDIGALRKSLLAAELPLQALELARMSGAGMRQERQVSLGLEGGFSTEG